jgi:hypothetical protein
MSGSWRVVIRAAEARSDTASMCTCCLLPTEMSYMDAVSRNAGLQLQRVTSTVTIPDGCKIAAAAAAFSHPPSGLPSLLLVQATQPLRQPSSAVCQPFPVACLSLPRTSLLLRCTSSLTGGQASCRCCTTPGLGASRCEFSLFFKSCVDNVISTCA